MISYADHQEDRLEDHHHNGLWLAINLISTAISPIFYIVVAENNLLIRSHKSFKCHDFLKM